MKNWTYRNKKVNKLSDMPMGTIGFVYIITKEDGSYYVGKKSLYSTVKKPPLKGKLRKRTVTAESNWKEYKSSNKEVQQWVDTQREILHLCNSKIELTYFENKALYCLSVLEDEKSMNGNISGKIYKSSIMKEFIKPSLT